MKIINKISASKNIVEIDTDILPDGYAIIPDDMDATEFYEYNGFATLAVDESNVVTAITPDLEAWEAWRVSLPDEHTSQSEARESAYATWTAYEDETPYYVKGSTSLTVDQIRDEMQYYIGDTSEYGQAKYEELSTAYTNAREDIRTRIPDEVEVE